MSRFSLILALGTALLVARGFETPSLSSPQSAVPAPVSSQSEATPESVTPAGECTPGDDRLCCPFPQGCSCLGDQFCRADGTWSACFGAGRAGQPCP
ncbi:MAG TPA: hypothetical protein VFT22_23725 [Kofleriaceae bacterium]|nr:hypothetical protein [Kofleriaceae bacterium]